MKFLPSLFSLRATNPSFKEVLSRIESHEDCRNLPMISFLILPMQRVTRLPLLMDVRHDWVALSSVGSRSAVNLMKEKSSSSTYIDASSPLYIISRLSEKVLFGWKVSLLSYIFRNHLQVGFVWSLEDLEDSTHSTLFEMGRIQWYLEI